MAACQALASRPPALRNKTAEPGPHPAVALGPSLLITLGGCRQAAAAEAAAARGPAARQRLRHRGRPRRCHPGCGAAGANLARLQVVRLRQPPSVGAEGRGVLSAELSKCVFDFATKTLTIGNDVQADCPTFLLTPEQLSRPVHLQHVVPRQTGPRHGECVKRLPASGTARCAWTGTAPRARTQRPAAPSRSP